MFGWEYPPYNSGGLGVACEGLAQALADRGENMTFVLPRKIPVSGRGINFIFSDVGKNKRHNTLTTSYPMSFITREDGTQVSFYGMGLLQDVIEYRNAVKKIIRDLEFDVIHAHDWLSFGAGISAKELSGKPLVTQIHATEYDRTGGLSKNEIVYGLEREGFVKADKVVAVSQYTKNIVEREYGVRSSKIKVIHNGSNEPSSICEKEYDLSAFKKQGKKIVIWFGRVTLQKGVDYLIESAEKVIARDKNIIFIIAGSGDMKDKLMQDVAYKKLSDKIIFTDFLRGPELQCLIDAADLYVMTSVSEPFGLAPLEVLHKNVPVIIPYQSGVSEVLTHALKVNFWDTDEITNKILSALHYPALLETLSYGGRIEAKSQTWDLAAGKCIALYNSLIPQFI